MQRRRDVLHALWARDRHVPVAAGKASSDTLEALFGYSRIERNPLVLRWIELNTKVPKLGLMWGEQSFVGIEVAKGVIIAGFRVFL
jgi:hypothetical protein